ncbi:MAG: hypothetical protein M1835_008201 [Candelina submexicana]|nr:MAG: hypothetical protein M1835_008201 [Candelina submexicana]
MSFLLDSTFLHGIPKRSGGANGKAIAPDLWRRHSVSSQGVLSPLVRLFRHPTSIVGNVVEGLQEGLSPEERAEWLEFQNRQQILYHRLRNAMTYKEWEAAARELDIVEGNDSWKSDPNSPEYDCALVEARLRQLDNARISCDVSRMLFLVRTALTRDLGDMGNIKLYKHSHIGTKSLIDRYINSALETLTALLDISSRRGSGLESKYILEQVLSTRQAFGRSALLLSGGATLGMNHVGVLKALWEARLLPRIVSGASAGSIVCAVLCTRTDEEMPELLDTFCYGDLAVFEKEGDEDSILRKLARFLKFGALFDISHLTRVMKDLLGDLTFQEAYNRTRKILNICVSSASLYELPRLLNYVTAPNVLIWSAVAASCSVPFLFSAASLLAKDPRTGEAIPWNPTPQRYIDGSVDNDLPMTRLAEMFNVNHFIVSQVNPHVIPFLMREEEDIASEAQETAYSTSSAAGWLYTISNLAKGEALHRMHVLAEMGILPNILTKARSVLSQKYSGDITIFPEISYADFPRMLKNPTTEFLLQAMLCGERAAWPKLSRIRNHCAIELALDDAVQKLRARVVFSPSQIDLRLNTFSENRSKAGQLGTGRGRERWNKNRGRMSQSTEPDSAPKSKQSSSKPPRQNMNTKSQSIDGTIHKTNTPKELPLKPPSKRAPPPSLIIPPHDFTSSGADSSRYTTSDTDDEAPLSSSTDSPTAPIAPTLWPTTRQLFPSASQPTTPSASHVRLHFDSSLSNSSNAHHLTTIPTLASTSPTIPISSLHMTPSSPDSERKDKRLFRQAPGRYSPRIGDSKPRAPANGSIKRDNRPEWDISGTRGMVLRKKSSPSLHRKSGEW